RTKSFAPTKASSPKRGPARYGLEPSHGNKHMILQYFVDRCSTAVRLLFDCCSRLVRQSFDTASTPLRQLFHCPSRNLRQCFGKMPKHKRTTTGPIPEYIRTNPERVLDAMRSILLRGHLRNGSGASSGLRLDLYCAPAGLRLAPPV